MSIETTQATIQTLDELLEQERQTLLDGDLDHLVSLLEQKENLIETLNGCEDAQDESLTQLQSKVLRNQALLDSALQGIRSVASKMSTLHRIRRTLDTYDESGRKTTIESLTDRQVEKRA